ncbi:LAMI_0F05534g1_1 [Lachancea mirantina]|uniref:LAMI_0F05534g1_1 n=1 Tax=Lachancea mirantina TaxID=1230905 RepID=A0A1G4JYB2_9SACH|nr:LAMI_0F05534g1_1 [Lachancea mirantina]
MALTNARPPALSALESDTIRNTVSPKFQANTLGDTSFESLTGKESSSSRSKLTVAAHEKTNELLKSLPVTGERPSPKEEDPFMEDQVLHAIFTILWEHDTEEKGMTVKQLCDFLLVKRPEMADLSTKLSNLVSAKLNAYIKKVERGESTLMYSLSREWSDQSPRRMVYVYRGILATDFKAQAQAASLQKYVSKTKGGNQGSKKSQRSTVGPNTASSDSSLSGISRSTGSQSPFSSNLFSSEYNVPYASSPVSMSLAPTISEATLNPVAADHVHVVAHGGKHRVGASPDFEPSKKHKTSLKVTPGYVTAAAAAPRLSKIAARKHFSVTEQSAALVNALHRIAATQKPVEVTLTVFENAGNDNHSEQQSEVTISTSSWLEAVRSGFLLQDIESPETLSSEDLDNFFAQS